MISELSKVLESLDLSADWIGIRAVHESTTQRSVRDGHPEANGKSLSRGAMVEVLTQGQIGYSAGII